jgi:predicted dehydrogenase
MTHRFAFVGFRHAHIMDMYHRCMAHEEIDVVACCEVDPATRLSLAKSGTVHITHEDYTAMLSDVPLDVVAVGDCYGMRAQRIVAALRSGKHVISDKPICISREELDEIVHIARQYGLVVGCMLDMRDHPVFLEFRRLIRQGEIGEVHAISFAGQHPLLYGRRPAWYFEPGMHGGVFNDIAVHALDALPWITGRDIRKITAARAWNASVRQHSHFQQCGQLMLELENGAGVIGDVSYLTPDSFGYTFPGYWQFTFWGNKGVLAGSVNAKSLTVFREGQNEAAEIELPTGAGGAYLDSFLSEISGKTTGLHLSSSDVIMASRAALRLQEAADQEQYGVTLS